MQCEQTFVMVKPDGVQRGIVSEVVARFEQKGYTLLALKLCKPHISLIDKHYAEHIGKSFFRGLTKYISSGPVCAMVWAGEDIVSQGRKMVGSTNPLASAPSTLRSTFTIDVSRNLVHASDSVASAKREISIWFTNEEIIDWSK
jgi:nucleoside-diphosphate kinase